MDSFLPEKKPQVKRLSELLQEQQEPFRLDVYLMERWYLKSSRSTSGGGSNGLKRRKRTPSCPKILKTVLNKIVSSKDVLKTSASCDGRAHRVAEAGRFSSASSMTVYESCSESDMGDEFTSPEENQISSSCSDTSQTFKLCSLRDQVMVTDRTQQCECLEDSKQHSPVSVLEELPSDELSPFHNHSQSLQLQTFPFHTSKYARKCLIIFGCLVPKTVRCCSRSSTNETPSTSNFNQPKRVTEASILSASLWDLLAHSSLEKQGNVGVKELRELLETPSQYRKTKRVVEQSKQLLFDCVREVLETHGQNEQINKFLGAEQTGKIICKQICFWAKQSCNVTNVRQMIISGFLESEDWNVFQPQTRKIGIDVSMAILEEMENEIVSDMIDCFRNKR